MTTMPGQSPSKRALLAALDELIDQLETEVDERSSGLPPNNGPVAAYAKGQIEVLVRMVDQLRSIIDAAE